MDEKKQILIETIRTKYENLSPYMTERARRIWAATEAESLGWGGLTLIHQATGLAISTIRSGLSELRHPTPLEPTRVRRPGGGRKKLQDQDNTLLSDLDSLIDPVTRGDPESPLRWSSKSTHKLAEELSSHHQVSQRSICNLLSQMGYSLQSNRKTKEGSHHPDRNSQFEFISEQATYFLEMSCPVLSVDTKKKENIGEFKNNGQEYCRKRTPVEVNDHDFPDKKLGKVAPYGVYDIGKNKGWVSVGISHDTAEFAVNTIRSWWYKMGQSVYTDADKILITADCGGSNGYRVRLWKVELQKLANELKKAIYVCHFPPGTSKWNKIEHRMFSYISKNWRGKPLISRETVVELIGHTKTRKGLEIQAQLDENRYEKGIKISEDEMKGLNIRKKDFHGEWNYAILPQNSKISG